MRHEQDKSTQEAQQHQVQRKLTRDGEAPSTEVHNTQIRHIVASCCMLHCLDFLRQGKQPNSFNQSSRNAGRHGRLRPGNSIADIRRHKKKA
jgi:hypothetical protein